MHSAYEAAAIVTTRETVTDAVRMWHPATTKDSKMIATYQSTRRRFAGLLAILGAASAVVALLGVGFAIVGTAMMTVM